jgi:23S rRNA pseudouridine1911/1915/1917 synthase
MVRTLGMKLNEGYGYRHVLCPKASGQSALAYLVQRFAHSNQSEWQIRLEAGEIVLDGKTATGTEPVRAGSVLIWNRPAWLEQDTPQQYNVIYRDEHLLAVDKPSGLPTIPGAGFYLNTLLTFVRSDFSTARPLHRLGRATSGLVLFALDTQTASTISQGWPKVRKQYQALSRLVASEESYDIRSPIGEIAHPRLGKVYAASESGKSARSVARTLQRRYDSTVFEVDLHTGRPHQIRIHLAFIGHPLMGDTLYAAGGQLRTDQPGLPGDAGYWLHAKRLIFEHPVSGDLLDLQAPLPDCLRID